MKKYKITFLFDITNLWFEKQFKKFFLRKSKKYFFSIKKDYKKIKNQDVVFVINYTKILPEFFLEQNKLTLIPHPSKLPREKGFAPVQNQILKNKKKIYFSLIKAEKKVDSGAIYLQNNFYLDGTELSEEIRLKQGMALLKLIDNFLKIYPKIKAKQQKGKSNFNRRRKKEDSELNINKSIKEQFNLLRINDNQLYPSFFKYKKTKYVLKIFKKK